MPIATGTGSESLLALDAGRQRSSNSRVPYPMGFYHRGHGRPDRRSEGRLEGQWNVGELRQSHAWHYEGGKGTLSKAVKFQLRPDPLAH